EAAPHAPPGAGGGCVGGGGGGRAAGGGLWGGGRAPPPAARAGKKPPPQAAHPAHPAHAASEPVRLCLAWVPPHARHGRRSYAWCSPVPCTSSRKRSRISVRSTSSFVGGGGSATSSWRVRISHPRNLTMKRKRTTAMIRKLTTSPSNRPYGISLPSMTAFHS